MRFFFRYPLSAAPKGSRRNSYQQPANPFQKCNIDVSICDSDSLRRYVVEQPPQNHKRARRMKNVYGDLKKRRLCENIENPRRQSVTDRTERPLPKGEGWGRELVLVGLSWGVWINRFGDSHKNWLNIKWDSFVAKVQILTKL